MTKKTKAVKETKINRPERMKLSAEESLKRTKDFDKRKEKFIAAIRSAVDTDEVEIENTIVGSPDVT